MAISNRAAAAHAFNRCRMPAAMHPAAAVVAAAAPLALALALAAVAAAVAAAPPAAPAEAAEAPPDPGRPYAPIYFDRPSYTWTDKVRITIAAPSWNVHANAIDTIGGIESHPVRVSTRGHELSPYVLTETEPGSGVFYGEVILTGFVNDVDGDGRPDTAPRTGGTGPTGGRLQADRTDAVTVSFEFRENLVLTESAPVGWTEARLRIDDPERDAGGAGGWAAAVSAVEPDMNLNPEAVDRLVVEVTSDSDTAGALVDLIETGEDTGTFKGQLLIAPDRRPGGSGTVRAAPGDSLTATYVDRTLPPPAGRTGSLDVSATAAIPAAAAAAALPDVPPLRRAALSGLSVSGEGIGPLEGGLGAPAPGAAGGHPLIAVRVSSLAPYAQDYVVIFRVAELGGDGRDAGAGAPGRTVSISWVQGSLAPMQSADVSQSWRPPPGLGGPERYAAEAFVWNSLSSPSPLGKPMRVTFLAGS